MSPLNIAKVMWAEEEEGKSYSSRGIKYTKMAGWGGEERKVKVCGDAWNLPLGKSVCTLLRLHKKCEQTDSSNP